MSEPFTGRQKGDKKSPAIPASDTRNLFQRIVEFVSPGVDSRDELFAILANAEEREVIATQTRMMLEGVLRMAELTAGDVMVPAPHMDFLDIDTDYDEMLRAVIATGHSRFPVYENKRDNVIGILMAKDLLKLQRVPELNLRTMLRPAVFVPESKGLNELLRDFRSNRNHLAIVIDEFGSTAGLITIEDVLEQIVGDIRDEFDEKSDDSTEIYALAGGGYRVAGDTSITTVNESFETQLPMEPFDTIGGLVAQEYGQVPRRGDSVNLGGLIFTVMLTRGGAVRWFKVTRAPEETLSSNGA